MEYFLKANGLLIVLWLFYYFFLRNETFFKSIRVYFLMGLALLITIPLIEIPIYVEQAVSNVNYYLVEQSSTNIIIAEPTFDWFQVLMLMYLAGVVFFGLKFIIQLFSLGKLFANHKIIRQGNYKLIETDKDTSPFSFFNYIIYNKSQFSVEELNQIITHEKTHANQWHSIDTLLTYILQIIFWFNPFAWLYKKTTQQNLEFLADASVSKQTENPKHYQFTLLKVCNTKYCEAITNNFYNSIIKKRIVMLQKNKSNNRKHWKFALLLPVFALFLMSFNTKTVYVPVETSTDVKLQDMQSSKVIKIVIDKSTTNAELEEIKESLSKKDADFSYTVVRNLKNEIIKIDVQLNSKHGNVTGTYNFNITKGIDQNILITIDNKIGTISIGDDSIKNYHLPITQQNVNNDYLEIITKNFKKKDLKQLQSRLKDENIDMSYDNLKYNKNKEIINISITIKKDKNSSSATWSGDKPIPYIKVGFSKGHVVCSSSYDDTNLNTDKETITVVEGYYNSNELNKTEDEVVKIVEESNGESKWKVNGYKYDNTTNGDKLIKNENNKQESNNLSKWKVSSGRNNVAFRTADTLYLYEKKNSSVFPGMDELRSNPIYIIDGIESTKETFDNLNQQNIASISVVKDTKSSISSKYSGKDGVVYITTKNLKHEKPTVELSSSALYILNGKETTREAIELILPDKIKSINVLKDKKATDKYGDKGKNGVVEITSKENKKTIKLNSKNVMDVKDPLYVLDNKIISVDSFKRINPNDIKSMNVLKGEKATDKYGDKGKNGVIEITLKKE